VAIFNRLTAKKPISNDRAEFLKKAMDKYDKDKDRYSEAYNTSLEAIDLGYNPRFPKRLDARDYGLPQGYRRGNRQNYEKKLGIG
jgi:hypothetical protein